MAAQAISALTPVQAQVVLALAQGATVTAAATAAGINRCTIPEWRRTHKEFDLAVQEARDEYRVVMRDSLCELSRVSLSTLRALIEDPETPAAVRGRLALAVLLQLKVSPFEPPSRDRPAGPVEAPPLQRNPTESNASSASEPQPAASAQHNPSQSNTSGASPVHRVPPPPVDDSKIGRNELCPCGSGKKFKRCCLPILTPPTASGIELK